MTQPYLEIALHLSNGRTHRFVQNDPALAQETLGQIGPKVFARPSLVIAGGHRSAAYAASALMGISLQMDEVPEALLRSGPLPFLPSEITEADYLAKEPKMFPAMPGEPLDTVVAIEFVSGHRLWTEAHVPQASNQMQGRQLLHNIFSMPVLMCRNLSGGLTLWNVAQMVSCCLTPELDAPTNAWKAEFISP